VDDPGLWDRLGVDGGRDRQPRRTGRHDVSPDERLLRRADEVDGRARGRRGRRGGRAMGGAARPRRRRARLRRTPAGRVRVRPRGDLDGRPPAGRSGADRHRARPRRVRDRRLRHLAGRRRATRRRLGRRRRLLRSAEVPLVSARRESAHAQRSCDGQDPRPRPAAAVVVSRPLASGRVLGRRPLVPPHRADHERLRVTRGAPARRRGGNRGTVGAPSRSRQRPEGGSSGVGPRNERGRRVLAPEPERGAGARRRRRRRGHRSPPR